MRDCLDVGIWENYGLSEFPRKNVYDFRLVPFIYLTSIFDKLSKSIQIWKIN